ncbi:hypothetical protein CSKR_113667 [Clonorchis sinensis]|uniref:PITH domain-containing protein n=1 Tax=Clonorchis sinensis TaxID=79923 RepID=A0A8T1M1Z0_CLOSI|nr:hypothetical protein CSKR_113667 [Clonorchis sinensis]
MLRLCYKLPVNWTNIGFVNQIVALVRPQRTLSLFSRFRLKRETEKQDADQACKTNVDSEAIKMWTEAVQNFGQHDTSCVHQPSAVLNRIQSRRLKRRAFLHAINVYLERYGKTRRGFNQFALNALDKMPEYEVTDDLDCYKAILRVFPPGRMVVTSFLQAEWNHFPRQQDTVIKLLQQMSKHHVIPDDEVGQMIIDIFGWRCHAMTHYRHLMYWVPKLAHANPWPVAQHILDDLDEDPLHLARLIAERICSDPMAELRLVRLSDSKCDNSQQPSSMISAQTPEQMALLTYAVNGNRTSKSAQKTVIYLDGPHFVWYQRLQGAYYTLWTELDVSRLKKEAECAKLRDQTASKPDLSCLPVFGHFGSSVDSELDEVPEAATATMPAQIQRHVRQSLPITTDISRIPSDRPTTQMSRVQPEYDNRWLALRRSHTYSFLPGQLTIHEQAEGTILAVGVVTPISDALVNQKTVFTHHVSEGLKSADDSPERFSTVPEIPPVPQPAPPSLIRTWLKELQFQNPCLANATLVIRVPLLEDSCAEESSHFPDSARKLDERASEVLISVPSSLYQYIVETGKTTQGRCLPAIIPVLQGNCIASEFLTGLSVRGLTTGRLYQFIDLHNLECLNEAVIGSGKSVFKPYEDRKNTTVYVESDSDEELLFNVPFTGSVKLKAIIIAGDNMGSHPNLVTLYKNKPFMTFSDTEMEAGLHFYQQTLSRFTALLANMSSCSLPPINTALQTVSGHDLEIEVLEDDVIRLFHKQEYFRQAYNETLTQIRALREENPNFIAEHDFCVEEHLDQCVDSDDDSLDDVELSPEMEEFMIQTIKHREERDRQRALADQVNCQREKPPPIKRGKHTDIPVMSDIVSQRSFLAVRMGIRGLSSYLSRDPDNYEAFQLHGSRVIIDANNFLNYIYLTSGLYTQFGGEYLSFEVCITRIINAFRRCAVKPIFVFDGCHDDSKLITQLARSRMRLQICRSLIRQSVQHADPTHNSLRVPLLPPLAVMVLAQTLHHLKVDLVVCDRESDCDAVSLAIHFNCPVISNDSDFYITIPNSTDTGAVLLPLSLVTFEPRISAHTCSCSLKCRGQMSQFYMPCYKFRPYGPGLGRLPSPQRKLFASVVGNDYISPDVFASALPTTQGLREPLSRKASKEVRINRRRSIYKHLINWLSGFGSDVEEPVNRILNRFPLAARAQRKELLLKCMANYDVDSVCVATTLVPFLKLEMKNVTRDSESEEDEEEEEEEDIDEISLPNIDDRFQESRSSSPTGSYNDSTGEQGNFDPTNVIKEQHSHPMVSSAIGASRPSITANWPPLLVHKFRHLQLYPGFFDAVYCQALVINCSVESLHQSKSIFACSTPVRQLIYSLLLGLEKAGNHLYPLVSPDRVGNFLLVEYMRRGNWQLKPCALQVAPIDFSEGNTESGDRRLSLLGRFFNPVLFSREMDPWILSITLLASIWLADGSNLSDDPSSSPTLLSFFAICVASKILRDNRLLRSTNKLKHHLTTSADNLNRLISATTNKTGAKPQGHLQLHIVHSFGQLQSIYISLLTLGSLLDSLTTDVERDYVKCCLEMPAITLTFSSGRLFHSMACYLALQSPANRLGATLSTIFPNLLLNHDHHVRTASVQLAQFFSLLDLMRKDCRLSRIATSSSVHHPHSVIPLIPVMMRHPGTEKPKNKKKRRSNNPKKKLGIKSMTEIEAEVDRIMRENGLVDC